MTAPLTIGDVARLSGVPAKTIRYYEDIDLVPAPERAANGYRVYDTRAVETLRFVKRARDLGFSIDDVTELLALWHDDTRTSGEVKQLVRRHIADVEHKIAELEGLRRTLQSLADHCHGDDRPDCPILDDLSLGPDLES
jgi:MerR family copper efflux transcriptional regulator